MMSVSEAIQTWREMQQQVSFQSLNANKSQHELVHEILHVVSVEIRAGRMTYEDFERRVAA